MDKTTLLNTIQMEYAQFESLIAPLPVVCWQRAFPQTRVSWRCQWSTKNPGRIRHQQY